MGIEIRSTDPSEFRAASDATSIALLQSPMDDEKWETRKDGWADMPSFTAWDGDRCVGHAGQFLVETVVPGGARLGTGAVTRVGVIPTHRRRGLARDLMNALINDAVGRDLSLMSLRASEAVIYQRFGFGMAGNYVEAKLDAKRARPLKTADSAVSGVLELLDPKEVISTVSAVYNRALGQRAGQITRPAFFWDRYFEKAVEQKDGSFVVGHRNEDGVIDGFAHYTVRWASSTDGDDANGGVGSVHDVVAENPEVELALWQFLLNVDLVHTWTLHWRPVDDPLQEAMADRRAYKITATHDEQWVRLVDVDAALTARSYNQAHMSVTINVDDPLLPVNNGLWRISGDGAERVDGATADLLVDVTTLGALYMGGVSWAVLAAAGRIKVADRSTDSDAIARADTLFSQRPAPYCGTFF